MRDPPLLMSQANSVYEFTHYTSVIHQSFPCAVDMDYPRVSTMETWWDLTEQPQFEISKSEL